MTTAAVIATRFFPDALSRLTDVLARDAIVPVVVPDVFGRGHDWSLYRIWNAGLHIARDVMRATYVVVMNDDAVILPGTIEALTSVLSEHSEVGIVYPDAARPLEYGLSPHGLTPTTGTWGAGGMTGFCFAFRADLPLSFDEAYRWWYGDDDFEERVRGLGLDVVRLEGVPIQHYSGQSAMRDWTPISALIAADRALWDARHAIGALGAPAAFVGQAAV